MHLIHQRPNFICVRHLTSVMSDRLVGGGRGGLLVLSDDHIPFLSTTQRGAACYPLPPLPSFSPIILSVLLLLFALSRLLISSLVFILQFFLLFFPTPRFVCAQVKPVSMESGELPNSSGADVVVEDLLLCACQFQDNAATSLTSTRGSCGRCVYGRGVCVNLLYPFPSIYSGIQTKKVKMPHFSLLFPVRLIFTSHNDECAVSQLHNTLPQSAKRFSDYSSCSTQCACTPPSVFFFFF